MCMALFLWAGTVGWRAVACRTVCYTPLIHVWHRVPRRLGIATGSWCLHCRVVVSIVTAWTMRSGAVAKSTIVVAPGVHRGASEGGLPFAVATTWRRCLGGSGRGWCTGKKMHSYSNDLLKDKNLTYFVDVSWGVVGPGFVVVTSGGFWVGPTLPGLILMSEHPRKVSWGPQPTQLCPVTRSVPQLFPAL